MTTITTIPTTRQNNEFFEVRTSIYAGSNERKAFDKEALAEMGFLNSDLAAVKAVLNTEILSKEVFNPFLTIRKGVQDFLASYGLSHPLTGRVFNPKNRIEIIQFLTKKQEEYENEKRLFLGHFDFNIEQQLNKIEDQAIKKGLDPKPIIDAVKKVQPSKEYYANKMDFSFLDVSVQFDSIQWKEQIDKINKDLVEKSIYELKRDSDKIRDMENPLSRAKKLIELGERYISLEFYVKTRLLGQSIIEAVKQNGDKKPAKEYSQRESLMLSAIALLMSQNARSLIDGSVDFDILYQSQCNRVDHLLDEESIIEEQKLNSHENVMTGTAPPESVPKSPVGTFSF